jgi:DNA-directed RNA polymerase subunit RPC12/RpoP
MILPCNICEYKIDVPDSTTAGARITCPNCFAQLGLYKYKGQFVLGCAICKEPVFDPNACALCERSRERKSLLEEGKL